MVLEAGNCKGTAVAAGEAFVTWYYRLYDVKADRNSDSLRSLSGSDGRLNVNMPDVNVGTVICFPCKLN